MGSEAQKRLLQYRASRAQGVPETDAAIGALPEVTPDTALMNIKAMDEPIINMPVGEVNNKETSKALAKQGALLNFTQQGLSLDQAETLYNEVFEEVPDTDYPVNYDRLDKALNNFRNDVTAANVERASNVGRMFDRIQFAGTALQGLFGNVQQAYYSTLIGEKIDNTLARLWPSADMRDDEGVVKRKAVVPMAAKAVTMGTMQLALNVLTFGKFGSEGSVLSKEANEAMRMLGESEYAENLLTGSEMIEFWQYGDGLIGSRLPSAGTPEREEYDNIVKASNAESYALMEERGVMGRAAMAGLALMGASYDIFADPVLLIAEAPVKMIEGGRALLPASSRARAVGTIADKSRRTTDLAVAVTEAETWVKDSATKFAKTPNKQNADRVAHAEKYFLRMQNRVANSQGPEETILLRVHPRVNPEHIEPIGQVYLGNPVSERANLTRQFISEQVDAAGAEAVTLSKRAKDAAAAKPGSQLSLLPEDAPKLAEEAAVARGKLAEWKETQRWFRKRMEAEQGSRTAAFFKKSTSDQIPYQSTHLPDEIIAGKGIGESVPPLDIVETTIGAAYGPGEATGLANLVDKLARKIVSGAGSAEIKLTLDELIAVVTEQRKNAALTGTGGEATFKMPVEKFGTPVSQLMKAGNAWATGWQKALDGRVDELANFARKIVQGSSSVGISDQSTTLIKAVNDIVELLKPINKSDIEGLAAAANSAKRGAGKGGGEILDTPWDMLVARTKGASDMASVPGRTKAEALKEIQKNIERGIAQGASNEEIIQWQRTFTEILEGSDSRVAGIARSTASSDDIVATAIHQQRISALSQPIEPVLEPGLPQRLAFGPDQTESAAEAARVLAGGGEIDDVMFHGTSVELYNTSWAARVRPASGSERRAASAVGQVARGKKAIEEGEFAGELLASEAEWLGKPAVTTALEAADWQQTLAEKMGDQFAKGLYPKTWFPRAPWFIQNMREPMRVLQSQNPRLYTRVHDAVNAQEFEMTRMSEFFSRELNILGVYKKVKGVDVINPEESAKFFRIMNTDPTTDDFVRAISTLSEAERRSLSRIRGELDFMKNKQGLDGTALTIEGYIDHVFDPRWMDEGARVPQWQGGTGANPDVFTKHLMPRSGNAGYTEDLALSLDNYTKAVGRKLYIEPLLNDLQSEAARIVKQNPKDQWLADYLMDMTNNLKGKPSTLGQWVDRGMSALNARVRASAAVNKVARGAGLANEQITGPSLFTAGEGLSKAPGPVGRLGAHMMSEGVRITTEGSTMAVKGFPRYIRGDASRTALGVSALSYTSVLGGSGRYFPMAIATGMATTGSKYGVFGTLGGILKMATPEGRALAKQIGLEKQWVQILDDAAWTKVGRMAANMPSINGGTVFGPSISGTENTIRGWTLHAAMSDLIRKNGFNAWSDVVKAGRANEFISESLRITEEVNHLFGMLGKPPIFGRISKSGSTASTQFLSFIPKQTEELLAQTLENPGRIGQYMMISGYLQRTAAKAGLDISEYVGTGFLPSSPDETTSIATETMVSFFDVAGEMTALTMGQGNKAKAQKAGERLLRNLQNFVPVMLALQRTTRGVETQRLARTFSGQRMGRNIDLGRFKWDNSQSIAENMSRVPEGFASQEGTGPTEQLSVLSGMDSIAGRLEREQYQAGVQAASDRIFRRRQIANAWKNAIQDGNTEKAVEQMNIAISEGLLDVNIDAMVERSAMELVMPRLLLQQLKSDQAIVDGVRTSQEKQAEYDFRFNR